MDELKKIEEIINSLDSINLDDWNKQKNETEEEYEERIQNLQEEIEEELIDAISDSLLNEQKIDEEETLKEAKEKIEKEYEIYKDAFKKDDNGKLQLKSSEELSMLGYNSKEEVEKITTIAGNYNNPELYLESIKKSLRENKDIDAEIERKMKIAKSYISAKIKKEENITPSYEEKTKKYEDNNNYLRTTKYLNKIPVVQNEIISNNMLIEQSYLTYMQIKKVATIQQNNTIPTIVRTKTVSKTSKIVTNPVKAKVLKNVENKMDETNDLTKQKIKARTELKKIFKEYENKVLSEEEAKELNSKIVKIEKKYPNIDNKKTLLKLYEGFNVNLPEKNKETKVIKLPISRPRLKVDKEKITSKISIIGQAIGNAKQKGNEKLEELFKKHDKKMVEKLSGVNVEEDVSDIEKKYANALLLFEIAKENNSEKQQLEESEKDIEECATWYINDGDYYKATTCIDKLKSILKYERNKYYEIANKQYKEGNIKEFKETVRPYLLKRYRLNSLRINNEYKNGDKRYARKLFKDLLGKFGINLNKKELNKTISNGIITGTYYKEDSATGELKNVKITGDEQLEKLNEQEKFKKEPENKALSIDKKTQQNMENEPKVVATIKQKTENEEKNEQEEKNNSKNEIENNSYINEIDEFLKSDFSDDKDRNIRRICDGYRYLLGGGINGKAGPTLVEKDTKKARIYLAKVFAYIRYLKDQAETKYDDPIKNIKNEARFGDVINTFINGIILTQKNGIKRVVKDIDGLELMINAENLKRINNRMNYESLQEQIENCETRLKNGKLVGLYALETLGDIYYSGIAEKNGKEIIKPDKYKAKNIYEKMIKDNKISNSIIYNRLLELYNDYKSPMYDKKKAEQLETIMKQKQIKKLDKTKEQKQLNNVQKPCTYVCSDLHGEYEAYKTILNRIGKNDKLYILGDVIDRGPDDIKILQDIIERQKDGQIEFLMGNHEEFMLRSILGDMKKENMWSVNNKETREKYEALSKDEQKKIKDFLLNSLIYKQIKAGNQDYYLIHAKAIQDEEKLSQTYKEMATSEEGKLKIIEALNDSPNYECSKNDIAKKGIFTIIGHNPTFGKIELGKDYVEIDCGISYGFNVALLNLTEGNVEYYSAEQIREKGKENQKDNSPKR